jgi:glycosyltransferase involved in cell wall biosynthesis
MSVSEPHSWLRAFERTHGRPLRVLHIGNIANNGYNNAKIQRNHGIEADVVCYDYYHIMGTPEWEDAEIKGAVGDPFFPDWWAVDLGAWQRPDWFVQGPLLDCIAFLKAKIGSDKRECTVAKMRLVNDYWHLVRQRQALKSRSGLFSGPFTSRFMLQTCAIAPEAQNAAMLYAADRLRTRISNDLSSLIGPRVMGLGDLEQLKKLTEVSKLKLGETARTRASTAPLNRTSAYKETLSQDARTIGYFALRGALFGPMFLIRSAARQLRQRVSRNGALAAAGAGDRRTSIHRTYLKAFPLKSKSELAGDLRYAEILSGYFADVLGHYDVIQGYSTDGLIPLFAGVKNFAAYEHGTLREIPFQDNLQGRLCHFTYKMAPAVFVTNTDVLASIARIGIAPKRVVHLPHAFNDAKLRAFRDDNPDLAPAAGPPVFFSPTRHHWHKGDGSWLKGNDVFLRAASRLAKEGRTFKLVLVEWGVEVAKSKALIAELNLTYVVEWVPPMTKRQLWKFYCLSHAVIDQFTLPAIGGVAFETLALGRRLITRIDEATLAHFFGATPPIFNGSNVDEITDRMRDVLDDPDDHAGRGLLGRNWIQTYHSAERVVSLQLKAYETILTAAEPTGQIKADSLV